MRTIRPGDAAGRGEGAGGREEAAGQCTDVYVFAARSSDKQEDLKLLQLGLPGEQRAEHVMGHKAEGCD